MEASQLARFPPEVLAQISSYLTFQELLTCGTELRGNWPVGVQLELGRRRILGLSAISVSQELSLTKKYVLICKTFFKILVGFRKVNKLLQEEIEGVYATAGLEQPVGQSGSITEFRKAINLLAPQLTYLELVNRPRLPPRIPPIILAAKLESLEALSLVSDTFHERELNICQAVPAEAIKSFSLSHSGQLEKQFIFTRDRVFDYTLLAKLLEKTENLRKISLPVHQLKAADELLSKLPESLEELNLRHLTPVDAVSLKSPVEPKFRNLKVFKSSAPVVLSEKVAVFLSNFRKLRVEHYHHFKRVDWDGHKEI